MGRDGVYTDDPSEAVAYLRDKVIHKKLGSGGMEVRPSSLPMGDRYLGLARAQAANRIDLAAIPRVAIGPPRHKLIPVWVIPRQGVTPADVDATLAAVPLEAPNGKVGTSTYEVGFPADTDPGRLVAWAQHAAPAQGVAPGQAWQWTARGGDQMPG
jgi:hypothetical protein